MAFRSYDTKLIEEWRIEVFVEERYASYMTNIGMKIRSSEVILEELAIYVTKTSAPTNPQR